MRGCGREMNFEPLLLIGCRSLRQRRGVKCCAHRFALEVVLEVLGLCSKEVEACESGNNKSPSLSSDSVIAEETRMYILHIYANPYLHPASEAVDQDTEVIILLTARPTAPTETRMIKSSISHIASRSTPG